MLRLAFDFIITWRETRTRPNAYFIVNEKKKAHRVLRHTFKSLYSPLYQTVQTTARDYSTQP